MAATLTTLSNIIKLFYEPPVRKQFPDSIVLMQDIAPRGDMVDGRYVIVPLQYGYNQGVGARGERGKLPTARSNQYAVSSNELKTNYGRILLSGHVVRSTRTDKGAFVRAMKSEMKGLRKSIKNDYNRQLFGDGTGKLAAVSTNFTNSTTMIVDSSQYLRLDMEIYIFSSTATDYAIITGIDGTTITLSSAATGYAASGIYRGDETLSETSKDKEIQGLQQLAATTNNTVQNIDRSSAANYWWRPASVNTATTALTFSAMQTIWTAIEEEEGEPDRIYTTHAIRDFYGDLFESQRRWVNIQRLQGGREYLAFNGKPVIPDKDCPTKHMFIFDRSALSIQRKSGWQFMDMDGAVLERITNEDAYEATMFYDSEFVTDHSKLLGAFTGITGT